MLDKAKSEINGKTDILFDYAVYEKDRQRVIAISVTIEPVDKQVADQKLNEITKLRSKRLRKKTTALEVAETGTLDDDPNILTLDYVSVPETTIPYSYGATPDLMAQELGVKAELDKLALVLAPEELDAVHVIIDAMVRMAGAPSDKMIDGGNAVFFQTVNNVIDNCKGLRRWFEGVASPLRGQGHSHGPHQACPHALPVQVHHERPRRLPPIRGGHRGRRTAG